MLAQASAILPFPSETVEAALITPSHKWSVALDGDGGKLLASVGITVGRIPVYKHVQLTVGQASVSSGTGRMFLPVDWESVGGPPIFPKMEGTLHVEPYVTGQTKITLNARYDPPFGDLGKLIDRMVMHRVAQVTMTDFVDRLAGALSAELEKV